MSVCLCELEGGTSQRPTVEACWSAPSPEPLRWRPFLVAREAEPADLLRVVSVEARSAARRRRAPRCAPRSAVRRQASGPRPRDRAASIGFPLFRPDCLLLPPTKPILMRCYKNFPNVSPIVRIISRQCYVRIDTRNYTYSPSSVSEFTRSTRESRRSTREFPIVSQATSFSIAAIRSPGKIETAQVDVHDVEFCKRRMSARAPKS